MHAYLKYGLIDEVDRAIDEQIAPIEKDQRVDPDPMVCSFCDFSALKQCLVLVVDWAFQVFGAFVKESCKYYGQNIDCYEDENRDKLLPKTILAKFLESEHDP